MATLHSAQDIEANLLVRAELIEVVCLTCICAYFICSWHAADFML